MESNGHGENVVEKLVRKWKTEQDQQGYLPCFDPDFSSNCPNLFQLMTWKEVAGLKKPPGTVTIQADGDAWKFTYRDPGSGRWIAVMARNLQEGWIKLELALTDPETCWNGGKREQRSIREKKK